MQVAPDIKAHNISMFAEIAWDLFNEINADVPAQARSRLASLLDQIRISAASLSDDVDPTNLRGAYLELFTQEHAANFIKAAQLHADQEPGYDTTNVALLPRK